MISEPSERRVFHARATLIEGTDELRPLSDLETLAPGEWAAAMAKYDDSPERRRLRSTLIPIIDCAWTEVVFLSPVHPHAIWDAWRQLTDEALDPMEFWSIPVEAVPVDAVVFDRRSSRVGDPIDPGEVVPLDRLSFCTAHTVPPASRDWLALLAATGKRGGWFNQIPHVLSRGPVVLDGADVISWEQPA